MCHLHGSRSAGTSEKPQTPSPYINLVYKHPHETFSTIGAKMEHVKVAAGMEGRCQMFKPGCLDADPAKACPSVLVLKNEFLQRRRVDGDDAHVYQIGCVQPN